MDPGSQAPDLPAIRFPVEPLQFWLWSRRVVEPVWLQRRLRKEGCTLWDMRLAWDELGARLLEYVCMHASTQLEYVCVHAFTQ